MAAKLMRAVQYDRYGGGGAALELVEVPIPTPKRGQLLLKVEATSLNPADWKIQKGMLRPCVPWKFPFTPGTDVAGEVVEVGSGVANFKIGDKVVTFLDFRAGGGLAEYAVAEAKITVILPVGITPVAAAGIPMVGLTALQSLRDLHIDLATADTPANVLITAASGGIGLYTIQLAKLYNCHITATCGARNVDLVKTLGADEALDYKTPAGATLLSPSGKKYRAMVNCAPGISWSTLEANLVNGGRVADVVQPTIRDVARAALQKVGFSKKRRFIFLLTSDVDGLRFLVDLLDKGQLKTIVDSTFPLEQAAEAFAKCIEGRATGKIIIEMSTGNVAEPH